MREYCPDNGKVIEAYVQSVYKRTFSCGAVVQLCVARNRHRRSALMYKAAAQVTSPLL